MNPPIVSSPLPPSVSVHVDLCWPKVGQPVSLLCLSRSWVGVWSHWFMGKTHPCLKPAGCPGCHEREGKRLWAAYLTGYDRLLCRRRVLVLPKRTIETSLILRYPDADLRGSVIEAIREGQNPNGPVRVNVRQGVERVPEDAVDPDTIAILCSIWRVMLPSYFAAAHLPEGGAK